MDYEQLPEPLVFHIFEMPPLYVAIDEKDIAAGRLRACFQMVHPVIDLSARPAAAGCPGEIGPCKANFRPVLFGLLLNTMKKLSDIISDIFAKGKKLPAITGPFRLMADRTAAEICGDFELQEEARPHLSGKPMPHEFVDRLFRARLYADATRFLAYGLPKRQAVWWACLCVMNVPACCGDEIAAEAMKAAEAWVKNPSEENCQMALTAAGKHNFDMPGAPAAWTAMAAGWSGGATMDDENVPAHPEHLTAHAASGAIILAATVEPEKAKEMYRKFLETGVQIAQGKMQISP